MLWRNSEHYPDPTAFAAPRKWKIDKEKPMNCSKQRHEKRGNFKRLQSEAYRDMPKVKNRNLGRF